MPKVTTIVPKINAKKLSALKNGLVDSSDALKWINIEINKLIVRCEQIIKEDKER